MDPNYPPSGSNQYPPNYVPDPNSNPQSLVNNQYPPMYAPYNDPNLHSQNYYQGPEILGNPSAPHYDPSNPYSQNVSYPAQVIYTQPPPVYYQNYHEEGSRGRTTGRTTGRGSHHNDDCYHGRGRHTKRGR